MSTLTAERRDVRLIRPGELDKFPSRYWAAVVDGEL